MGLFSKPKDKNVLFSLYSAFLDGKEVLQIMTLIFDFNDSLNRFSSGPLSQKFWNDIKELYGKDVDEQELLKVFKFFMFISSLEVVFKETAKHVSPIETINKGWGYNIYKDYLKGKLDVETFKELVEKIWTYYYGEFLEKYKKYKEQKDEQPK